jgi:DNA-binding helix-hairpin-helix protein with protein kinase domain
MAQPTLVDGQGKRLSLGIELGRGGEASVFSVEGNPTLVAKVYHQPPTAEKSEKLSRMVELQNERLLALAAWPMGTLLSAGHRSVAGFLMKNVSGFKDIHLLYSPKSRIREFPPKANWRFLIHAAANVARAFSVVHEQGHVIGDVNQSNVRVSPETAIVNLIDCDSFQISANGKLYPCEVGVPLYTPPELQEMEFKEVVRTENHDNFGLAVLIFHLLFMGRHPFAGKYLGRGEMPIEKAIAEQRFAFAEDVRRTQMQPPPASLTLEYLPGEIGDLFTKAFSPSAIRGGRPDGKQWITALHGLGTHLMICTTNKAHLYFDGLPACPWCQIESFGVVLFVDYAILDTSSGFNMELVWSQVLAIPSPGPGELPSFRKLTSGIQPSARGRAAARKNLLIQAGGIAALLGAFVFRVVNDYGLTIAAYSLYLVPVFVGIKKFLGTQAASAFHEEAREAEARLSDLREAWDREASATIFTQKLEALRALAAECREMPEQRKQKLRALERTLYETQLNHYLERFDIASADIPHIADGRKAMLAAYGIQDAKGVTRAAVEAVPGFGSFLVTHLMTWRQSLEARFKFNPGRGIDPMDIQRIDRDLAKRRAEIELMLTKGPGELREVRQRIVAARTRLQSQLEKAAVDVAQAQADETAAA